MKFYIDALKWAEACVFCFPTWWAGMPAILKGHFDRVLCPGTAFEQPPGGGLIKPALLNFKQLAVVTTCGSSWFYSRVLMQDPTLKVMLRGLKATCGGLGVRQLYAQHSISDISPKARETFLHKVERRFARLQGALGMPGECLRSPQTESSGNALSSVTAIGAKPTLDFAPVS